MSKKNGNNSPNDPRPAARPAPPRWVDARGPEVTRLSANCFVVPMYMLNPRQPIKHFRKPQPEQQ